ncbi:LysR family transcriptional regulator [Acinetobacter sp. MD2(2019)]|uniref:LysR family transcriptional regulator n=1 Tax=Acinetobacter sp. MD2(2019) TaxID=2605273 RepID=UPI002D1F57F8|nr:LysR family transcriptional regulator [Acinetobacter sp. MD2(2019)]MEB3754625.1 LysR family transcriptional regulator [Acinetobacter sp. MD2(2019)]
MFDYRQIEIFQAVMKTGSITAAAQLLFTSQPTISREIARLEHVCGFQLFERKHAKIYPTEAAFILYEEVLQAHIGLERMIHTAQQIQQHQFSTLKLCCLPFLATTLLPKTIANFKAQAAQTALSITPLESPFIESQLSSQQFHLGLIENQTIPTGTSLQVTFTSQEVCILPEGHALLAKACLSLEDFNDVEFISFSAQDPYRQQIDAIFAQANIQRKISIETQSAHAICKLVQQGLGVSIVNPLVMLDYVNQGLAWRPLSVSIPFTLNLVRANHRPKSALVEIFNHALMGQLQNIQHTLQQHHLPTQLERFDLVN